jgi:hypothetical protein
VLGAIAVRGYSGLGVQFGVGRNRVEIAYRSMESGALVAKLSEWKYLGEFLLTVPLT